MQNIINKLFENQIRPYQIKKGIIKKKSNLTEILKSVLIKKEFVTDNLKPTKPNLNLKVN